MMLNSDFRDYTFYNETGWFQSEFYYPVNFNPVKKLDGKFFDIISKKMT